MKKQKKLKRYILMGVALIFVVSGSVFGYNWYRDAQRPFYDHGQCEARFDVCEPMKYAHEDLEKVRAYFANKYGIENNKIDILGGTLRKQALDTVLTYTYRVEIMKGYAFTFTLKDSTMADYLDGFGYDYVKELDDTQGMIAGLFYEMKHGKDYPEIKEILETEDLLYLADDYKYNSTIQLRFEKPDAQPYFYQAPQFDADIAKGMKKYLETQGKDRQALDNILMQIDHLQWGKKLTLLPYTKDSEKLKIESETYGKEQKGFGSYGLFLENKIKANKRYQPFKFKVEILEHHGEREVKKWKGR